MDHKSNQSSHEELQTKISAKCRRTQLLAFLGNWASEMNSICSLEENNQVLETIWEGFLLSDYADDGDTRRDVYLLIQKLDELFLGLQNRSHDDFREVDKWILKQTA